MPAVAYKPNEVVRFLSEREFCIGVASIQHGFASVACDVLTHQEGVALIADEQGRFGIVDRTSDERASAAKYYDASPDAE